MQKLKVSIIIALAAAGGIAMTVTGCRTEESYREERKEKAVAVYRDVKAKEYHKGMTLSLDDCISFAIRNNMSVKVANMERDVAERMRTAEILES